MTHFRQYRAEHHGGAHRLQRVFRAGEQRRRGAVTDPLQRGQHFADDRAASIQRLLQAALIFVERGEPRLRRFDLGLDAARARCSVDQVLVELAAVGADLLDLALECGFGFGRLALRVTGGLELLVVPLERVEGFALVGLCRRGRFVASLLRAERTGERKRQC